MVWVLELDLLIICSLIAQLPAVITSPSLVNRLATNWTDSETDFVSSRHDAGWVAESTSARTT